MPVGPKRTLKGISYEQWMVLVDRHCDQLCGLTTDDLPDMCYRDMYEDEVSPRSAARAAIRNANEG